MNNLVSVIMPVYNAEKFVADAVRSVQAQTFSDWQLIICDDGSSDTSLKIVRSLANDDDRIIIIRNNGPKGAAGARNECLSRARGRYIAFLDADDTWLPLKLEKQIKFMENNQSSFVFGYCENMSEQGNFLSITKAPAVVSFRKLSLSNFIPCLTVIYDAHILGKVEQPNTKRSNDFALWLKILQQNKGVEARCYPEVLAKYRVNNYGLSANKLAGINYFYMCLRQFAGLGRLMAFFCTCSAIAFKALKTLSPRTYNIVVSRFF